MSFRFIHAADLHLDTPFIGLSHLPHEIRDQIKQSTFSALNNLVELCLRKKVDFLIVSGDVYDAEDRSLTAQLQFQQAMQRLADAGISSFIAHGNHDPLDGYRARLRFPSSARVFSGEEVEALPVFKNGEEIARIYGMSYPTSRVTERLVRRFQREADAPYAIGVLHANVGGNDQHDNYAPCSIEELTEANMDYWALGHIHTRQIVKNAHPTIVYPGNTQGRSAKESGAKGCMLVEVNRNKETKLTFCALDRVRWFDLHIEVEPSADEQDLIDRIDEEINGLKAENGQRSIIARLQLKVGQTLSRQLERTAFLRDLIARYRIIGEPFLWLLQIEWSQSFAAEEDPFLLELLERLNALKHDSTLRERTLREAWAPLLNEHPLGGKWLTRLAEENIDWEKDVERLIRQVK